MKTTKTLIAASLIMFISGACLAQNNQKEQEENHQLTITGITGQSIKESSDVNNIAKLIEKINNEIYQEKLAVKDISNLSYMLNSEVFIINGVKQISEIHMRYKNKYIKGNTKWNICKNYKIKQSKS